MAVMIEETTGEAGARVFRVAFPDEELTAKIVVEERHNVALSDEPARFEAVPGGPVLTNGQVADALSHLVSALNHRRMVRNLSA